jgi:hypothetical protein
MQTSSMNVGGPPDSRSDVGRGILTGLTPLVSVVGVVVVALLLTALVRALMTSQGFFAQQQAAVIVLGIGLLAAIVVYVVACARALRQARAWLGAGQEASASAAYWSLGATALIVLLPVALALLLPQHPAP